MGGKKLDLLKIWQRVQEAGGFEQVSAKAYYHCLKRRYAGSLTKLPTLCLQVTQSRTWKQVGDPFNFPVTCTNSAYVLKAVYIKYMVRTCNVGRDLFLFLYADNERLAGLRRRKGMGKAVGTTK